MMTMKPKPMIAVSTFHIFPMINKYNGIEEKNIFGELLQRFLFMIDGAWI